MLLTSVILFSLVYIEGSDGFGFKIPQFGFSFNEPVIPEDLTNVMNFDMPVEAPSNVNTERKNYTKDGLDYKTTTISGPGFNSFVEEVVSKNPKNNNLSPGFKLLDFVKKKCSSKKCKPNQYCEPLRGCRERLPIGSPCALKKQCNGSLLCIWGKCNVGIKGEAGTLCNNNTDCDSNTSCVKHTSTFHGICTPKLNEGAICDEVGFFKLLTDLNQEATSSVCEDGLKCASVGIDQRYKRCVKKGFVETPVKENDKDDKDTENESGADKEKNDEDDEEEGSTDKESEEKKEPIEKTKGDKISIGEKIPIKMGTPNKKKSKKSNAKNKKTSSK